MAEVSLNSRVIALSMSPSNDLERLGYPEREFDRLVFELVMQILRSRGRVLYGGHLGKGGLTVRIFEHLAEAYAGGFGADAETSERPILNLLPQNEFARTPFASLLAIIQNFCSFAEFRIVLKPDWIVRVITIPQADGDQRALKLLAIGATAKPIVLSSQSEFGAFAKEVCTAPPEASLEMMRRYSSEIASGRIVVGGKRGDLGVADGKDRYDGKMPGIYEEVIASLGAECPTIILGAYGGAARDLALDLAILTNVDLKGAKKMPFLGNAQDGNEIAREELSNLPRAMEDGVRSALEQFALRDDTETLARDVVKWLAAKPRSAAAMGEMPA